jgi:hypothetical protein
MPIIATAPVAFSGPYTVLTGTAVQYLPFTAAGVTAGNPSGNFKLIATESDLLNGVDFSMTFAGWFKSHGSSQTLAVGLYCNPYTSATAPTGNGTLTSATATASGTLTAATTYDFFFTQKFVGSSNSGTLTFQTPTIYIAGASVSQAANTTPLAVTFVTSSQTEPITGINNSFVWPLADFYVGITDGVSDTTATLQLTEMYLSQSF